MRRGRLEQFLAIVPEDVRCVRILDVGGTEEAWLPLWNERCERLAITLLNLTPAEKPKKLPMRSVAADARDLSNFETGEFDFCFSNSVIEHMGTFADQQKMANEIRRVAKGYFIQTPHRYFPLEPHFHVPGWAQLPLWCRVELHRRMNLGWMRAEPDYQKARMEVEQIRLLSMGEFRLLFSDGEIRMEKIGPFIKSMMAVRRWPRVPGSSQ